MIRRHSAWASQDESQKTAAISGRVGNEEMADKLRCIRSYVIEPNGRLGTCCIYEAVDGEPISEHALRVGIPGDEFLSVAATVLVRPDPEAP